MQYFLLPGGRQEKGISEIKIYKQIVSICIFNFLLQNTFETALPFELLQRQTPTALTETLQIVMKNDTVILELLFSLKKITAA